MSKNQTPLEMSISTTLKGARVEHEATVITRSEDGAEVVARSESGSAAERLREIEMECLEHGLVVVRDAMDFDALADDAAGPPEHWLDTMTAEEAVRRFRRIRAGQMKSAECPVGLKVATNIVTSVLKKNREQGHSPTLNIRVAEMTIAPPSYPSIKITQDGSK